MEEPIDGSIRQIQQQRHRRQQSSGEQRAVAPFLRGLRARLFPSWSISPHGIFSVFPTTRIYGIMWATVQSKIRAARKLWRMTMAALGGAGGSSAGAIHEGSSMFKLLTSAPRPRELTGAADLITHYGLREHYETYTKKSFPASIAESRYLRDVVGDIEIRKGEGMELGQLLQGSVGSDMFPVDIHPFDLESLRRAFTFRESGPVSLPEADRGLPTIGKSKDEKERKKHKKHKKHRDKEKDKDKDKEKRKDKHKDKDKDHAGKGENGEDRSKKHKKKKRRHDGDEEEGKHKKKKHKDKHSPNPDAAALLKAR